VSEAGAEVAPAQPGNGGPPPGAEAGTAGIAGSGGVAGYAGPAAEAGPAGDVGAALRAVAPGRLRAYEELLHAVARGRLWMLLWQGAPGSPDARYGALRVDGQSYVPCVTSEAELAASTWPRGHEVLPGARIAAALHRRHWGLWLDPHAPGGGVGIPWADLRRIALGLDRVPAGPLDIAEPAPLVRAEAFYACLTREAPELPALRSLRRAWVAPAVGEAYLAIGAEFAPSASAAELRAEAGRLREVLRRALAAEPPGCAVSLLRVPDEDDPVALWMTATRTAEFWTRGI